MRSGFLVNGVLPSSVFLTPPPANLDSCGHGPNQASMRQQKFEADLKIFERNNSFPQLNFHTFYPFFIEVFSAHHCTVCASVKSLHSNDPAVGKMTPDNAPFTGYNPVSFGPIDLNF